MADGTRLVAVVKRDCPTCVLVVPALMALRAAAPLTVYSQDDPAFPEALGGALDDTGLEQSWRLNVETVPTPGWPVWRPHCRPSNRAAARSA